MENAKTIPLHFTLEYEGPRDQGSLSAYTQPILHESLQLKWMTMLYNSNVLDSHIHGVRIFLVITL
jgi:hypothetical protein